MQAVEQKIKIETDAMGDQNSAVEYFLNPS